MHEYLFHTIKLKIILLGETALYGVPEAENMDTDNLELQLTPSDADGM